MYVRVYVRTPYGTVITKQETTPDTMPYHFSQHNIRYVSNTIWIFPTCMGISNYIEIFPTELILSNLERFFAIINGSFPTLFNYIHTQIGSLKWECVYEKGSYTNHMGNLAKIK